MQEGARDRKGATKELAEASERDSELVKAFFLLKIDLANGERRTKLIIKYETLERTCQTQRDGQSESAWQQTELLYSDRARI